MRFTGLVLSELALTDESQNVPKRVQYLRTGKFTHPKYGEFEITPMTLAEMKKNFDEGVRQIDVALDYSHESEGPASGWIKGFQLEENGTMLFADVDWTPQAEQKIRSKEFRYFSPDFGKYKNPETGIVYENVVFGGALTNRPFIKGMDSIIAHEEEEMKELEELKAANKKLSEDAAAAEQKYGEQKKLADDAAGKIAQLEAEIAAKIEELKALKSQNQVMAQENAQMKDKMALSEKETEFSKLLSEGKAVPAQKEAFIKGDLAEFVKLSEKPNLSSSGSSSGGAENISDDDKVLKLSEELRKNDPKLSAGDAISKAIDQLKKQ